MGCLKEHQRHLVGVPYLVDVRGRSPAGHGAAVVPGAAAATARGALWRHGNGALVHMECPSSPKSVA